ncbi:hypothetical protein [Blastococcus sp. SYSU DS0533]
MRLSRVLLAGVAVAGVAATSSAFTNSNTLPASDDTAGYGELAVSGVVVNNIAYTPLSTDATKLDKVTFTAAEDTTDMNAVMTLSSASGVMPGSASTCEYSFQDPAHLIICDVPDTVEIKLITKVGLTVTSK